MINQLLAFRPGYGWLPFTGLTAVTLSPGDTLRVDVTASYKGPEQDLTLYGSIGKRNEIIPVLNVGWFDEILHGEASFPCPESLASFTDVEGSVDIPIVGSGWFGIGGISPGTGYDLYVKIKEKPDAMDEADHIIDITSAPSMAQDMLGIGFMAMIGIALSAVISQISG